MRSRIVLEASKFRTPSHGSIPTFCKSSMENRTSFPFSILDSGSAFMRKYLGSSDPIDTISGGSEATPSSSIELDSLRDFRFFETSVFSEDEALAIFRFDGIEE